MSACTDCGAAQTWICRGLCRRCHRRHERDGTLDRHPPARPYYGGYGRRIPWDVDEVVVERILNGDWRLFANPSERTEVCRRWVEAGRAMNELRRLTGWKTERYYKREEAECRT